MDSAEYVIGYPITTEPKERCISRIVDWIDDGVRNRYLVCANPHSLQVAMFDRIFDLSIKKANIVIPDGAGIVLASRMLGGKIRERVTGSDIFLGLSEHLNARGDYTYFFLGSTEANLVKIAGRLRLDFPNIRVAGTFSPPFKTDFDDEDNRIMVKAINSSQPDVLWVGMTAPKQEKWIYRNKHKLDVKFVGAIGAVFDFYSGTVKRSGSLFQDHGLEWLPRLLKQPRRLWRRSLISAPSFFLRVLKQRVSGWNACI